MKTIRLPDELKLEPAQAVQVFDYRSSQEVAKQQIVLNRNTISFLTEGTKEVFFDNSALSADNSKFLIIKAGHCLMTEKLSDSRSYRSILLFFSTDILLRFIRKMGFSNAALKGYRSVFSFRYDAFTQRFARSLLDISLLSKEAQRQLLEIKFEEIMCYLTDIYGPEFLYALAERSDDTTQKFIQTIENNQLNRLTLKELAFLCNMSLSTFKREFEKHYAISPSKWFQNKRLEYAHYLLHKENRSSSEIYLEVGYENLSSFIQAYKTKYGITPKQHYKS